MNLPPLHALRAFEAAARCGSFSRAGDELHVTHSAISHQIKLLEEWFNRQLFVRGKRRVTLTRAGEELRLVVSDCLMRIDVISSSLKRDDQQSVISVGCIPSVASRWLIPLLNRFSEEHQGISVQVLYARAEERLSESGYDVLITLGEDPAPEVECIKLFSRVNHPVCSPHYLAKHGDIDSSADIATADLLHDETRNAWHVWFERAGVAEPDIMKGPVFQDFNLLATAVIAGHGVALCPVEIFDDEIKRGDLIVLSEIATEENEGYFVITDKSITRPVRTFCQWFLEDVARKRSTNPVAE